MVLQTDEEKSTKVGFMRLLAMNNREWPYILVGVISAAGQGAIMPLFAVILSSLIAALMPEVPFSKVLHFSILCWCLGAAQFVLASVQVCTRRPCVRPCVGAGHQGVSLKILQVTNMMMRRDTHRHPFIQYFLMYFMCLPLFDVVAYISTIYVPVGTPALSCCNSAAFDEAVECSIRCQNHILINHAVGTYAGS